MRVVEHRKQPLETRTGHLDPASPCGEGAAVPSRLARDLGLDGVPEDQEVVAVCLPFRLVAGSDGDLVGARCDNSRHLFVGTEDEAKGLRLAHLASQPETQDLSSRKLGALAGVSHAAVQRFRREEKQTQGETSETETV